MSRSSAPPGGGGADSRPSKTNRADGDDDTHGPSIHRSRQRRLTERDGVSLRAEVRDATERDDRPVRWATATKRWRDYIRDSREQAAVFRSRETGEETHAATPHRFSEAYSDKQYAKLCDLERGVRREYDRPYTAMLSLTTSSTDDDGRPLPPVDHLDRLLSSWDAVRRALSRCLDGRRWEYLAILEPHASGYLHAHVAVFVDGYVRRSTFREPIDAHLRNCPGAEREAHTLTGDDSAVSVYEVGDEAGDGEMGRISTYLAKYLGTYSGDPLDAEAAQQAANAVLWATGRQRWRPSQGAQQMMATARSTEPSEWELVAVIDGDERYPANSRGGGVDRFETGPAPPPG